jgi:anaerobic magnesium-protoporphyrin IX monomethyl ester cyclase
LIVSGGDRRRAVGLGPSAPVEAFENVVLVIPPDPLLVSCNRDAMGGMGVLLEKRSRPVYAPMDAVYAATILRSLGVATHVADSLGKELPVNRVTDLEPDLVGLKVSSQTLVTDLEWASRLKRDMPRAFVVAFGPAATEAAHEVLLHPAIDAIAPGEAEVSLVSMVRPEWRHAPGMQEGDEGPEDKPFVHDLNALPFPDWSLLPIERYSLAEVVAEKERAFPVLASRGCPLKCQYCSYPVAQGRRFRTRSVENVLDEIEALVARWGAKHILFRDPCFGTGRRWLKELCRGILDRRLRLTWRCETRAELLGGSVLDLMAEAGLRTVNIGVESVEPAVLQSVRRRQTLRQTAEVIRHCREVGVEACVFLLAGLPGDNPETFHRTVEWVAELQPPLVQILPLTLYPGTPLHAWATQCGTVRATTADPHLWGRSLVPTWWAPDQARTIAEAKISLAVAHAEWLRWGPEGRPVTGDAPSRAEPVRASPEERLRSYVQAARIAASRGRHREALEWLDAASETGPEHESVLVERGKVLDARGDRAAAEAEFRRALELSPRSPRALRHLVGILVKQHRWDEALPLLEDLLNCEDLIRSRRVHTHRVMATACARCGLHKRAEIHRKAWQELVSDGNHDWRLGV